MYVIKAKEGYMQILNKLKRMTDKQIQEWLRKIDTGNGITTLSIALLGANDEIKECVFRNMSIHAKTVLSDCIQEQRTKDFQESQIQNSAKLLEKLF